MWEVYLTDEVNQWLDSLGGTDHGSYQQVVSAIEALAEVGPNLGRPLADRIKGSTMHNLKELRPGSVGSSEIRVLFAFDPCAARSCSSVGTRQGTGGGGTEKPYHGPRGSTSCTSRSAVQRKREDHELRPLG